MLHNHIFVTQRKFRYVKVVNHYVAFCMSMNQKTVEIDGRIYYIFNVYDEIFNVKRNWSNVDVLLKILGVSPASQFRLFIRPAPFMQIFLELLRS